MEESEAKWSDSCEKHHKWVDNILQVHNDIINSHKEHCKTVFDRQEGRIHRLEEELAHKDKLNKEINELLEKTIKSAQFQLDIPNFKFDELIVTFREISQLLHSCAPTADVYDGVKKSINLQMDKVEETINSIRQELVETRVVVSARGGESSKLRTRHSTRRRTMEIMDTEEEEEDSEWVNERTLMETSLSSEGWKPWTTKLNEALP